MPVATIAKPIAAFCLSARIWLSTINSDTITNYIGATGTSGIRHAGA